MFTYADPRVCPSCREQLPQPVSAEHSCTTCGVSLGHPLAAAVFASLERTDTLVEQLRAVPVAAVASAPVRSPAPEIAAPTPFPRPFPGPVVPPLQMPARTGVRTSSVPAILLSLGALCLLVAAVAFLAVAWSWLGVGGRTTVLAGLTVATATGGLALQARGLRIAAESLVTVSLGMLVLDVLGAERAGWIGWIDRADGLDGSGLALTIGLVLAIGGALLATGKERLLVPQVAAVTGLFVAQATLPSVVGHDLVIAALATMAFVALVAAARQVGGLAPTAWVAAAAAVLTWLDLALSSIVGLDGLGELDTVTFQALWTSDNGLGLLTAALLLLAPLVVAHDESLLQVCATAAGIMLTGLAVLPVLDNGTTDVTLASLVAGGLWVAAAYAVPRARLAVPTVPAALSLLPGAFVAVTLAAQALESALTPTASLQLDPGEPVASSALLVPVVAAVVALVLVLVPSATRQAAFVRVALAAALLAGTATLALHPVALWTVVVALGLIGAAYVADALRRDDPGALVQLIASAALLLATIVVAAPSTGLLLVPLVLLGAGATATMLAGRFPSAEETGGLLLAPSLAGLTWVLGDLAGLDAYRAVPVLVVLAALALGRARLEVELPAAVAGAVAALAAVPIASDVTVSLALHLTLAGALVVGHSLVHPSRRPVAWIGTALLVLATWVRLADLGVSAPEAYTMPAAVLLLAVGLLRIRRDSDSSTALTLLPGLLLATVPSLLQVLGTDPVSLRAALLGIGCVALAVGGAQLRWSAPLLVGAVVGGLLALLELAPYAAQTPQWVVIGLAGTTLVVAGTTWERRLVDLHKATHYVGRLR